MFISGDPDVVPDSDVSATDVKELLLAHLFRSARTSEPTGERARVL